MIYVVWYMNYDNSPKIELYKYKTLAVERVGELLGKYDAIGISQERIEGGESDGKTDP